MMAKLTKQDKKEANGAKEFKSRLEFTKTKADHIAVFIIEILGSMTFLVACCLLFLVWITWNLNVLPVLQPFDPFPFPVLDLFVSAFAIILSVSVLINQNRQGRIDKIQRQVEFEVNVRAEHEITKILNMLHEIHQKMGLNSSTDKELEKMKEPIDVKQLHQTLDEKDINGEI